jgi:hypothetical protein
MQTQTSRSTTKLFAVAASAALTAGLVGLTSSPASAMEEHRLAWETPGTYTWTVPDYVYIIHVDTYGAQGGGGGWQEGVGGSGAHVYAQLSVTPGEQLTFVVGGTGHGSDGGYGGGGDGGSGELGLGLGGGGATSILNGTIPIVVAGGGGGAADLGVAGGGSGQPGGIGTVVGGFAASANGHQGEAGVWAGGQGGAGGSSDGVLDGCRYRDAGVAGTAGTFGQGGTGGEYPDSYPNNGGGGGGGGYFGGGGGGGGAFCEFTGLGAAGGGGGGGSSYVKTGTVVSAIDQGVRTGDGELDLYYAVN